ncbi:MAG: hypothetical protein NC253_03845 [Ruminococcus sp.]|nr:hypothetical protein [Ruminococcus sp.]MCM1381972.1 hypothetical protein [Muribaculaceae bacterium]MCM1478851.1 hypothetical protein [Muribaculaceae bacterium]
MTDKERKDAKIATIYEIRRIFQRGKAEKDNYTVDEILELLDNIADAKEQEM